MLRQQQKSSYQIHYRTSEMIKRTISKPFGFIKSILIRRKKRKIYLAHLEADFVRLRMQGEMKRSYSRHWD